MSQLLKKENINDSYFDGYYKDIWKAFIPNELTPKEVEFMVSYFHLDNKSRVLDLMCGYGRHAIELARRGVSVVAVDNLADYIDEVKETAETENLPLEAIQANVTNYETDEKFDLVICMGNSLNFFDQEDALELMKKVRNNLKPGGHFLINTWTLAEIAIKNFKEKSWSEIGGVKFLTNSQFLFSPARIETESTIILPDGKTETKHAVDYIFTVNEMESLLEKAGLVMNEVYSIPGRKKFTLGEPRAYIVAERKK